MGEARGTWEDGLGKEEKREHGVVQSEDRGGVKVDGWTNQGQWVTQQDEPRRRVGEIVRQLKQVAVCVVGGGFDFLRFDVDLIYQ